ncbi:hypothetical protein FB446DRAFT_821079, partial [Lentinula raphanica]
SAGILTAGIGISWSHTTCTLAIYSCISFYAVSKILIYAFLSEKVYIVWTGGNQASRHKTKVYRLCAFVLLGYFAIGILMVLGNAHTIRADGVCVIGLKAFATIPLIAYDLSLNIFLTAMFMCPLWILHPISPRLRSVAKRTLYGATISLVSSAVNIMIMLLLSGSELGWVCITSCVSDVVINSFAVFCVSSGSYSSDTVRDRFSLPTMDMSALTFAATESSRPTGVLTTIPEAYYDYLPPEHRKLSATDLEKSDFPSEKSAVSAALEGSKDSNVSRLHAKPSSSTSSPTYNHPDLPPPALVHTQLPKPKIHSRQHSYSENQSKGPDLDSCLQT